LTSLNSRVRLRNLERTLMRMADTIRKGPGTSQAYLGILVGLIFIKRSSDQFANIQHEFIQRLVEDGMTDEQAFAEAEFPENYPDSTLFCPPEARWVTNDGQGICQAPEVGLGNRLRNAVRALERTNPRMEMALSTSVDFSAMEGTKRILKDADYKRLIDEMNFNLSDAFLEFPDIMGAAYEFTVRNFTQNEEGRDAGAHYTPRELVDLLVRILDPVNGDTVYDPSSGSGGMLIYSKNHVDRIEDSSENLWLYGQELKGTSWAMSVINMIFHGVVNFKIKQGDTLVNPQHKKVGGAIRRFTKIIANMPFSMNYSKDQLTLKGRFPLGYPPKKFADFLFIQHMLSALESGGKIATICSTGILFRGNDELKIRRSLIERDVIEAVIAVPNNLFQNTGTTVAILVLRKRSLEKEPDLRDHILFINAENEFGDDRAKQSYLRPQDIEKIHRHYSEVIQLEDYSRLVPLDELREKNYSLNVRQYVDSTPKPNPQNVRAHISGCVPKDEVENIRESLCRFGIEVSDIFEERDELDFDFLDTITSNNDITSIINQLDGVHAIHSNLITTLNTWWIQSHPHLIEYVANDLNIVELEESLTNTLLESMAEQSILSDLEVRGSFAQWALKLRNDFQTLATTGWTGIIDSWASTYLTALVDKLELDELEKQVEITLFPERGLRIAEHEAAELGYKEQLMALDYGENWVDLDEEEIGEMEKESVNKKERAKELRVLKREARAAGQDFEAIQTELDLVAEWRREYKRIDELRKEEGRAIKRLRNPDHIQIELLDLINDLSDEDVQTIVLDLFFQQIEARFVESSIRKRNHAISRLKSMWERYQANLREIEESGVHFKTTLDNDLEVLGYDS
jgi:type I restriction enzyme M protein